jgi:hypothetical protein
VTINDCPNGRHRRGVDNNGASASRGVGAVDHVVSARVLGVYYLAGRDRVFTIALTAIVPFVGLEETVVVFELVVAPPEFVASPYD